jgi:hypothetical protein
MVVFFDLLHKKQKNKTLKTEVDSQWDNGYGSVLVYIYTCVATYVYIGRHSCFYIYIYIHIHVHVCIYRHIYIYI